MRNVKRAAGRLALPFFVPVGLLLHLWSANAELVVPSEVVRPLGWVLALTALGVFLALLAIRHPGRAALAVVAIALPVLTLGYQLDSMPVGDPSLMTWPLIAFNAGAMLAVTARLWPVADRAVDLGFVVVLVFSALALPGVIPSLGPIDTARRSANSPGTGPDIYYIVVDGYGRADTLSDHYGYDNTPFLSALEARGFYVAGEASSNYARTDLSLASSLNMRYLAATDDTTSLIQSSEVVRRLQAEGYRYVHFATPWVPTRHAPEADYRYGEGTIGEFELVFFRTTLPGRLLSSVGIHETHLSTLDGLADVPRIDEATFTLAHLILPHPPFVFDRDGNVIDDSGELGLGGGWNDRAAYVEQLSYLNDRLLGIVDHFLDQPGERPIILLQADHGPASVLSAQLASGDPDVVGYRERLSIFSAFLLPSHLRADVYPAISPVNTFRVLLMEPRLPDRSWFSWYSDHAGGELVEVTDLLGSHRP